MTKGVLVLALGFPQVSSAQGFTGAEFLTWSDEAQDSYIQTSITMATMVISETNNTAADCLDTWYLGEEDSQNERHAEIIGRINEFSTYHPSAVILVVIRNACGPLK